MVGDKVADHLPHWGASYVHFFRHLSRRGLSIGADAGFLFRIELRIHHQAVLQVIDSERRGLAEADRAQMSGDFDSPRVRCLHHRSQLVRPDELAAVVKAADRKSTRLNSSHGYISYAVFCLKKKKKKQKSLYRTY